MPRPRLLASARALAWPRAIVDRVLDLRTLNLNLSAVLP
jgi:hypothetical protein